MKLTKNYLKVFVISALGVYFLGMIFFGKNSFFSYLKLRKEVAMAQFTKSKLICENQQLKKDIFNFENDSFYLERAARQELYLGKKDELVYVFK
ncbi:TPA: hypothetical protein DEO28_01850 [Candidatus Dependentiae bacterium]|nr:MAG: hypothetical protein UR14_C0004G0059 [candidate division TM6 bacterium GW2011_GWE2_31_21]KKP52978.1 MAG: hypothetical protein UR43_C0008G0060 [candidate division TM6 bacterium GW2011_GWF2_33_332]HBS47785.1 hypothetical protein [Candidatus Dependentiae bacterium]HBZ73239.1 hypothetical protein [Candidatus Dependentiae bacterium]